MVSGSEALGGLSNSQLSGVKADFGSTSLEKPSTFGSRRISRHITLNKIQSIIVEDVEGEREAEAARESNDALKPNLIRSNDPVGTSS